VKSYANIIPIIGPKNRGVRIGVKSLEDRSTPASFRVTSVAGSGPGPLRQAVVDASRNDEPDTIGIDASLAGRTITLATDPTANCFKPTGLVIDHDDVEIDSGDAPFLQLSGGAQPAERGPRVDPQLATIERDT
jgi:hypothetical protein